jgi:TonB-dependent SusC/RagA subfamily outer membrane receptor
MHHPKKITFRCYISLLLLFQCIALGTYSQDVREKQIDINFQVTPLEAAMLVLEQKIHLSISFGRDYINLKQKVSFQAKHVPLKFVLAHILGGRRLTYSIEPHGIVLYPLPTDAPEDIRYDADYYIELKGYVFDENNSPLHGASIFLQRTGETTQTNAMGYFSLPQVLGNDSIIVSYVTHESRTLYVDNDGFHDITLPLDRKSLSEAKVVLGYTRHSLNDNPGIVSIVTPRQPALPAPHDFNEMLEGQVPGLLSKTTTGFPGALKRNQLEGQASIGTSAGIGNLPPNEPLYIVDGVTIAPGNYPVNQIKFSEGDPNAAGIAAGGPSPLACINALEIDTIAVLKDAAATAIYGSRGANGVVLITTKKGQPGKMRFDAHVNVGISRVPTTGGLLRTADYLIMRREALANDKQTATVTNDGDLLRWDTSHQF